MRRDNTRTEIAALRLRLHAQRGPMIVGIQAEVLQLIDRAETTCGADMITRGVIFIA